MPTPEQYVWTTALSDVPAVAMIVRERFEGGHERTHVHIQLDKAVSRQIILHMKRKFQWHAQNALIHRGTSKKPRFRARRGWIKSVSREIIIQVPEETLVSIPRQIYEDHILQCRRQEYRDRLKIVLILHAFKLAGVANMSQKTVRRIFCFSRIYIRP